MAASRRKASDTKGTAKISTIAAATKRPRRHSSSNRRDSAATIGGMKMTAMPFGLVRHAHAAAMPNATAWRQLLSSTYSAAQQDPSSANATTTMSHITLL